jgi:hypothetical protein
VPGSGTFSPDGFDGKSDLFIEGAATQTIGVPLSTEALAYLESQSEATVTVTADNGEIPPCQEIPLLAAGCAQYTHVSDYVSTDGDGIERTIVADLTVAGGG